MERKKTEEYDPGKPGFVPVQKWYEVHQDAEMRMLDHLEQRNIDGLIAVYRFQLMRTKCLIKKYIDDENRLKLDDIYELQNGLEDERTDFVSKNNNNLYTQIFDLIQLKMEYLFELWIKSGISLPLMKEQNLSEAVLQM